MNNEVLLVEDDDHLRQALKDLFRISGFKVKAVKSAKKGLEYFLKHQSDIVVTDLSMPGNYDGIDVVRRIKAFRPNTKVFVCTGYSDKLSKVESLVHKVFKKPFEFNTLTESMKSAL